MVSGTMLRFQAFLAVNSVPLPLLPYIPAVLRGARWDSSSDQEELLHGVPAAGPGQQPGGHGWAVGGRG